MKTVIKIEPCESPFCEIHAAQESKEIKKIAEKIRNLNLDGSTTILNGWDGDFCVQLKPTEIFRVYSSDKKVFIQTEKETFLLKMRLYEFEELVEKCGWTDFIRISNTDIINFSYVLKLDLSLSGIIKVILKNQYTVIVSRRYMNTVRSKLCLKK